MKRIGFMSSLLFLVIALVLGLNFGPAITAEHAGEHPGNETEEHAGTTDFGRNQKHFTANEIKSAIRDYIDSDQSLKHGYFYLYDEQLDYDWKLTFAKLHPVRVINRDGEKIYFACTNFDVQNDTEQYNLLDLDFWMKPEDGELEPYKIRVHKVDGEARFTYQDDRPVEK